MSEQLHKAFGMMHRALTEIGIEPVDVKIKMPMHEFAMLKLEFIRDMPTRADASSSTPENVMYYHGFYIEGAK